MLLVIGGVLVIACAAGGIWAWTPDMPRAALEARYLDLPDDLIEVAGVKLHVRDSGPKTAPTVIFIHGFGASLHTWEPWSKALAGDFRLIRFDLPGSGLSEPDPTGDYSDARSLQLLTALMDQLGVERAHVVGHSIGGRIAWQFAARHPERVSRLVLIAPDGFASPGVEYGKKPAVPASMQLMRYFLPKALLRMSLAPAYADASRLTGERVDRYHDLMLAPGSRDALLARWQQTVLEDPRPVLRGIQAPTLLLWGRKDAMIPFANSADYLDELPRATLFALPELGHVPHEEAPEVSLPRVAAFLSD